MDGKEGMAEIFSFFLSFYKVITRKLPP